MSGIDEGMLDKPRGEACILLYPEAAVYRRQGCHGYKTRQGQVFGSRCPNAGDTFLPTIFRQTAHADQALA